MRKTIPLLLLAAAGANATHDPRRPHPARRKEPNAMIRAVLEVRHDRGEEDIWCPQFFCDHCGGRLIHPGWALYLWSYPRRADGSYDDDDGASAPLYTVHKRCAPAFETAHGGTPGEAWPWDELRLLPFRLLVNLGYDEATISRFARELCGQ